MQPKQQKTKKVPSERTRNNRNPQKEVKETTLHPEVDAKTRVNTEIAALALRSASGVVKSPSNKKLSSKQKRRKEQMMEKADAFNNKIEKKADRYQKSQENIKKRAVSYRLSYLQALIY